MKVTIIAMGTRGDAEPCVGFAKRLEAAGHEVRVAGYLNSRSLIEGEGLRFAPIAADLDDIENSAHGRALLAAGGNLFKSIWHTRGLLDGFSEEYWRSYEEVCAGADAIVNHHGSPQVATIAERAGVPLVMASVLPFVGRSRAAPSPYIGPPPGPGPALNYLSHLFFEQIVWRSIGPAVNRWRRRAFGLPPLPFFGPFGAMQRQPILYGYSRHLLPRPPDWPANIRVTGFWETSLPSGWRPPAALVDFLSAGEPPIYVGFGSMKVGDAREHLRLVGEALRRAGRRGVVALKLSDELRAALPEHLYVAQGAPHDWLFPRTGGVVCHGGSGTVHRALRAGVPCAVYPYFGDQAIWGRQVHAVGAGPRPIPRPSLTLDNLTQTITAVARDASYRRGAEAVARLMEGEDGLGAALAAFDEFIDAGAAQLEAGGARRSAHGATSA
jgi:sterol 3beta-glucosyltransferase